MKYCHTTDSWLFCAYKLIYVVRVLTARGKIIVKQDYSAINTLRPRQNGRHFPDDIFKWIFLNENVWISINISLKFVPRGSINNIPTLVQVMAWRRPGDKPLSGPMMVRLPTHICVARPQWVKLPLHHEERHHFTTRDHLTRIEIPIIKIRRYHDRLIFIMVIPYLERSHWYWDGAQ